MERFDRRGGRRAGEDLAGAAPSGVGGWRPEDFDKVTTEELAQLAAANVLESQAYFELWRRTHPLVSEIVHRRLRGQDARHTVIAFFCHKLPRVLHRFTPRLRGSFDAWLATVTRNYLHDEWRRGRHRRTRQVPLDDEATYAAARARALAQPPQVEHKSEHDHLVFFLHQIMNQLLGSEDRYIFHARYWDDKSRKEIAAELGLSEENVRVRHFRAKKRLQKICVIYREAGIL